MTVLLTHDTEMGMRAAVALVNSAEVPDTLVAVEQLSDFFATYQYTGRFDGDDAELRAVRRLRPLLRRLFTSTRDDAVAIVNQLLDDHDARPKLVRHGDADWHLHAVTTDQPFATRIAVETAMAMIDVIRLDEMSRLAVCDDSTCDGLVFDLSRNRSRRFCSTACGNRVAVAAYRARRSH
jgi:predicted RNA-binding Zn ribbon-like protein